MPSMFINRVLTIARQCADNLHFAPCILFGFLLTVDVVIAGGAGTGADFSSCR